MRVRPTRWNIGYQEGLKIGQIRAYKDCLSHVSPEYPLHFYIRRKIRELSK